MMSHFRVKQKDAFFMTSCRYDNRDNIKGYVFFPVCSQTSNAMKSQREHLFYIYILKIYYDVLSFHLSKLFVAPNRTAIEETKELLTYNLCQLLIFFFSKERPKVDVIFCVRCTKFSEFLPQPTRFWTREKGTCSQDILVVQHDTGNMFNTLHLFIPANDLN